MKTLFENNDFRLILTGQDYDFVGIIETKTESPLTFFFAETLINEGEDNDEYVVDEDSTEFLDVCENLKEPADNEDYDETEEIAERWMMMFDHVDWFRTRDDKSTGLMADPKDRGMFLALVKNFCPNQLKNIPWAQ